MPATVEQFFDRVSAEYDDLIQVAVPRCDEVMRMLLHYLPPSFTPRTILELGCGTGSLTRHLAARWPGAEFTVVDISGEMLEKVQANLPSVRFTTRQCAFEQLELPAGSYDLVASSFAIHHLHDPDKAALLQSIGQWLAPGGFFIWADGFSSGNARLHQVNMDTYEALAREKGASEAMIAEWRAHRETLDHYARLEDVLAWFRAAGFESVDVLWRFCQNAVLQGQKPQ